MAYALDLSTFSLRRFAEITTTAQMLPSRQPLADGISDVVPRFEELGVTDLGALRKLLSDKNAYRQLGDRLDVDESFLKLLNREVNAYRTKPLPLAKLEVLSDGDLQGLADAGIKTSKDLYERCSIRADRAELARHVGVSPADLLIALKLSNLVRINGAGPVFAQFLLDLGMNGPEDVVAADSDSVIERFDASDSFDPTGPRLRPDDIDYCKRFCEGLQTDIEW
ncbi:MAG: DUF4332 domain-containing protein [bacterium]|nr:DUF4332 domain-containing protein [bacterium]